MDSASGSREAVLARIRAALKAPAIRVPAAVDKPVFPKAAPDLVATFRLQCKANLVECFVTTNHSDSAATLQEVLSALPDGGVFVQDSADLRDALGRWGGSVRWSSEEAVQESAQATITHCEALVAATGTIVVSSACAGRGGSVVAPVHVVMASESQIIPDLDATFSRLNQTGTPLRNSFIGFITGCSRTADIEKILVIGAHGPRRVIVILETGK